MTRPHEETWTAEPENTYEESALWMILDADRSLVGDTISEAQSRLMAAAPDMARVLLAVEWSDVGAGPECPSCTRAKKHGHTHDCTLDAALRKAGVR